MAETILFKCPACGGNLEFNAEEGRLVCPSCGNSYTEEELLRQSESREQEARRKGRAGRAGAREDLESRTAEAAGEAGKPGAEALKEYHCGNCGAQIVTGATTAAARCYYCHTPVVMADRVDEEYRPDGIIPFSIGQEEARSRFDMYLKKHRFTDRRFFSEAQLENFSGVYYPYWLGDVEAEGSYSGEGRTVSSVTTGNYIVTTTRYYHLEREGTLSFRNLVRKGLRTVDRKLADGIHPYELSGVKKFASGYLSGFLAEKWDVDASEAEESILEECRGYAEGLLTQDSGLQNLKGTTEMTPTEVRMRYVLMPSWVLTYTHEKKKKIYYYMMNGQNGRICGKLPIRRVRLTLACLILGGAVFALMCGGGAFLW